MHCDYKINSECRHQQHFGQFCGKVRPVICGTRFSLDLDRKAKVRRVLIEERLDYREFLIGEEALFKKSGSIVKLVRPQAMGGKYSAWVVKRKDSEKEMIVPETALKRI